MKEKFVKKDTSLPKGIYHHSKNAYSYYFKGKYYGFTNVNDAINDRTNRIEKQKVEDNIKFLAEPILRNADGYAIIEIFNKKKIKVCETMVSDDRYYDVKRYPWSYTNGYIQGTINGNPIKLSRYIMNCYSEDIMIDHENSNPLDNRTINLKYSDKDLNAQNRSSAKGSSSKYIGVSYDKNTSKWVSQLQHGKKTYKMGSFVLEIDAARARDHQAIQLNETLKTTYKINLSGSELNMKSQEPVKKCSSVYIGVTYNKLASKWKATVKHQRKDCHLGYFVKELDAALARDKKAIELNTTLKTTYKLNFPIK